MAAGFQSMCAVSLMKPPISGRFLVWKSWWPPSEAVRSPPVWCCRHRVSNRNALFVSMTPCELYERKVTMEQLHAAIAALPDKQAKRIYAYYFLGLTESAIAKSEGVSVASVSESIQRGLRNMETFLKNRL